MGDDAVAADVFGDVLLRVVGTHLRAVVDVLLEDVAEDVRVDVASRGSDAAVEVPMPLIEEGEELVKDVVGDVDLRVAGLDLVLGEHAAVQVGDASVGREKRLAARLAGGVESLAEEGAKEAAVEGLIERALLVLRLIFLELVSEVVRVFVKEPLLLQEVAEHEAVEHDGGVPFAVGVVGDVLNAVNESVMLCAEAAVEVLGHLLGVDEEGGVDAVDDVDDGDFLVEAEGDGADLLEEEGGLVGGGVLDRDEMTAIDAANGD